MRNLLVVEKPERWPFELPGAEIVSAWAYLTEPQFADSRRIAVYNACRVYGYQRPGYYVSLLAAARGHRAMPSVETLQAFGVAPLARITSDELDGLIQRALAPLKSAEFELSIYFGRNVAQRYDKLSKALFALFPAPFLRASFANDGDDWRLQSVRPLAGSDMPETHREFAIEQAATYFSKPGRAPARPQRARYEMAILWDETATDSASDESAIRKFIRTARKVGIEASVVAAEDYPYLAEYDALFIRDTTNVNHYTYRFAQRAAAQGLVVIDDPQSIIRCSNKVYQAELFERHDISHPRTLIVHQEKMVVAQEYLPSDFDWRIGVLNGHALYACRYFMARGHWQIIHRKEGSHRYGKVETLAIEDAPPEARDLAEQCARRIGTGLYGVDIKEVAGRFYVIEVNDNPSIDGGVEDEILKDDLYLAVMQVFRERLDARGAPDDPR